jgi:hypothetical protein
MFQNADIIVRCYTNAYPSLLNYVLNYIQFFTFINETITIVFKFKLLSEKYMPRYMCFNVLKVKNAKN